ncbi:hypothetical protein QW060_03020 [Myroides ceti]|uniref:Uncharacterized protein n=1 Tax=Paenimyroides ceti TaxID=395087 RepID=A0ABT8CNQ2_9FLAO|nr:hypothetical protein [Paenimyroides ceti]MDN3706093.1 hypothetical protein [Paenimyroides ceti]
MSTNITTEKAGLLSCYYLKTSLNCSYHIVVRIDLIYHTVLYQSKILYDLLFF